jgi:hypothetical protein
MAGPTSGRRRRRLKVAQMMRRVDEHEPTKRARL